MATRRRISEPLGWSVAFCFVTVTAESVRPSTQCGSAPLRTTRRPVDSRTPVTANVDGGRPRLEREAQEPGPMPGRFT